MLEQLARFGRRMASIRKEYAERTQEAEDFASDAGRQIKGEWQKTKAEFRAIRDQLKETLYEKLRCERGRTGEDFGDYAAGDGGDSEKVTSRFPALASQVSFALRRNHLILDDGVR